MPDDRLPGPIAGASADTDLTPGTLGRHTVLPPVVLGSPALTLPAARKGPFLVGKARRAAGFNFDGSPAEDMQYADKPAKSAVIMQDPVFKRTDAELSADMQQLMRSLSIGDMQIVALDMQERFCNGIGGTYSSALLDEEIANNAAFVKYHQDFLAKLRLALKQSNHDPQHITLIPMDLLNFSSFWDKASGLGITVHQVWSAKAELSHFAIDRVTGTWMCWLVYTFYDHFGLDWDDIVKHGDDRIPQYHTGAFFKAWYILQHYRSAKPFITEMTRKVFISGHV